MGSLESQKRWWLGEPDFTMWCVLVIPRNVCRLIYHLPKSHGEVTINSVPFLNS